MSPAAAQGLYLPVGGAPETDLEYAQHFVDLATAVEGCERSEDVAILISTCRNHWMATNAAFLDLRRALGSGDYPDSISAALYQLRRGRGRDSLKQLEKAGEYLAYARKKLGVWDERVALFSQLDVSIDNLPSLAKARVKEMLRQQRRHAPAPEVEHVKYLVISEREESICIEKMRKLKQAVIELTALRDVIREVAVLRGDEQGSLLEPSLEERDPSERLVGPLLADSEGWGLEIEDGQRVRFDSDGGAVFDLSARNPAEIWALFIGHLIEVSLRRLVELQELMVTNFKANVSRAPMPEPYIIDLTVGSYAGSGDEYEVKMHGAHRDSPPNQATVAMLRWPIPEGVYNDTDLCRFKQPETRELAGKIVCAAINAAADEGATFVILPELSIPGEVVDEMDRLSQERNIGVIAGREHRAHEDGLIANEVLIHIPELAGRIEQLKQHPSVDEPLSERFFVDRCINVIRGTSLGTMMVAVCSDYLEHDIVSWPWPDVHIDTLVVCARNSNPVVFERLAIADAIREFCNVIVVNAYPGDEKAGEKASGEGTLIAVPHRDRPLVPLTAKELDVDWTLGDKPSLGLATLDMKAIYSRSRGRSAQGYLRPSRFASRR